MPERSGMAAVSCAPLSAGPPADIAACGRAGIAAAKAEIPSCFWPAGSRPSCDHAAINLLAQTVASHPILGGDRADAHPLRHRSLRLFLCTKAKPGRWPVTTQSDGSAKGCAAPWPLDPCPDCNIFALFGLTATFPPAECLTAPALCLPRAVRGGDDSLARDSFLTRMKSSSVNRTNNIAKACR